ncbi:sensor histidine kinase [Paenibacillus lemnae]|uniref:histidine kinase n=2 Tax=Paenibacillus lemnae TaxID=1330551 RepID=A0A848M2J1_PAELE|nr:sensor histidine kinase [Paenibacillus lemnae]
MNAVLHHFIQRLRTVLPAVLLLLIFPSSVAGQAAHTFVPDWQVIWNVNGTALSEIPVVPGSQAKWESLTTYRQDGMDSGPAESVWFQTELPSLTWEQPAILLDAIEGKNVAVYIDGISIYQSNRDYMYTNHRLLLPIRPEDSGKTLNLWVEAPLNSAGIDEEISIGDYESMRGAFIRKDLSDFVMGSSFIFIGLLMFFCLFFLPRNNRSTWLALTLVIASCGILLVTYSPFLYTFYEEYGQIWVTSFDIALFILLPALTFYFQKIYGPGPFGITRCVVIFQTVYSLLCILFMVVHKLNNGQYYDAYYLFSVQILGIFIILQMLLLIGLTIISAVRKNKDAYISSIGFGLLSAASLGDLFFFYANNGEYHFYYWKWGVLAFIITLIVMLGRKFIRSHEQVVQYSKELELFNNELQRSEKMEIISELAASVAHEVRNPLQVTRGFMQLLTERAEEGQKEYLSLALKELDRASGIITDFLTFAKPELEHITVLELGDELRHVAGILNPLASLSGGVIKLDVPHQIYIDGNSSKLKQAMINLVKNSIEALDGDGTIKIWAVKDKDYAVISIRDNGIGMDMNELSRLGEPYFSNKTKGTGLGLMVTFRIIEAMNGKIQFTSHKGIGTEAVIRIPLSDTEQMEKN